MQFLQCARDRARQRIRRVTWIRVFKEVGAAPNRTFYERARRDFKRRVQRLARVQQFLFSELRLDRDRSQNSVRKCDGKAVMMEERRLLQCVEHEDVLLSAAARRIGWMQNKAGAH